MTRRDAVFLLTALPAAAQNTPISIIIYGDMRFTDPAETDATNPKARRWLVNQIAAEMPYAVLLSGDVPWNGGESNDYKVFQTETKPWRDAAIRVYPALGNHEFHADSEQIALENWWTAFPEYRGKRWYSVSLSPLAHAFNLDSNSSLLPASDQIKWLTAELLRVPASARVVFFNLHHPPVSDFQPEGDASHNARPNEVALRDFLTAAQRRSKARFVVNAGHVHNYERFLRDGVTYIVSGGGGAKPRAIVRTPEDLYRGTDFPNYHYVRFLIDDGGIRATMHRLQNPEADSPSWEIRDRFDLN